MEIDISKIYLVLAYNYQRYCDWCESVGIDPNGPGAKYIDYPHRFMGYKGSDVVVVKLGDWYENESYDRFSQFMRSITILQWDGAEVIHESV